MISRRLKLKPNNAVEADLERVLFQLAGVYTVPARNRHGRRKLLSRAAVVNCRGGRPRARGRMNLWVDDCKPEPEGWAIARTYDDAVALLSRYEYDEVAFDHDLGDTASPERTGYDLLCAIERGDLKKPKAARIISWNPVGRKKMAVLIERLWPRVG